MSVEITTTTERVIRCTLGTLTLHEETGTLRFNITGPTTSYYNVRELAKALGDVAVMMENCGGRDGTVE
jgi:hypothetical protein